MPSTHIATRWGASILIIGLAIAVNFGIQLLAPGRAPFLPFFPAIMGIAYFAGAGPALAALLLALVATDLFWLQPLGRFGVSDPADFAALALFLVSAAMAIGVSVVARKLLLESSRLRVRSEMALGAGRIATWHWDPPSDRITYSEYVQRVFGAPMARSEDFWRLTHPDDLPRARSVLGDALRSGRMFGLMTRIVRPDTGETRWIESYGLVERNAKGQPLAVTGITVDVSERQQALEGRQHAEQRERRRATELNTFLEAVPAAVFISRDRDCEVVTGNRLAYEILQSPPGANLSPVVSEGVGRQQIRVFNEDGRELAPHEFPLRVTASTGLPQRQVRLEIVLNGSRRSLFGNTEPLFAEDGTPAGAVGGFIDVSVRH